MAGLPAHSWARHFLETLRLGVPLIGAQIAQLAINTTDVLIVGRLGTADLAAIVLASQYFFTIFVFGSGISAAVIPMAAHAIGHGDMRDVRRSIRMGFWASIAFAVLAMPLFLYSKSILLFLGQDPQVAEKMSTYLHIAGWGVFPALLFMVLRAFLSVLSRTAIVLYITLVVLVLNAVFAYTFVLGNFGFPAFGLTAAAIIATGVQFFGLVVGAIYVQRIPALREYKLFVRFWRPDWPALSEVVRLAVPIGLTILAEISPFSVSSIMMGWIGTVQLAAHGIALQFASMSFMVPLGLSQAATVRVGLHAGRGDAAGIRMAAYAVIILSVGFSLATGGLFVLKSESLARLFIDPALSNASQLLAVAGPLIAIAGAFQLFDGLQTIGAGLTRGLKDSTIPMLLAMASYWGIGYWSADILAFPLHLGGVGIWCGFLAGLAAAAMALNARFFILTARWDRYKKASV